jgi:hypothetical protein
MKKLFVNLLVINVFCMTFDITGCVLAKKKRQVSQTMNSLAVQGI